MKQELDGSQSAEVRVARRPGIVAFGVACALLLVLHFAATVVTVFPPNAASYMVSAAVTRYMSPYFSQSWRLFAPDPGGPSLVMLVQCRSRGETTGWIDVTTPLYDATRPNRLSPARALHRLNKGAIGHFAGLRDPFIEHLKQKAAREPENRELRGLLDVVLERQAVKGSAEERARPLVRLATAYCRNMTSDEVQEVRVRIDSVELPPFSKRSEPIEWETVRAYELPWTTAVSVAALDL